MKKIRDGIGGELTFEIFQTWFPDKPELVLIDFLKSNKKMLAFVIPINERDVVVSRIDREYAQKLLEEGNEEERRY